MKPFHIVLDYRGKKIKGKLIPLEGKEVEGIPLIHKLILEGEDQGLIMCDADNWKATKIIDRHLVNEIGNYIQEWYE